MLNRYYDKQALESSFGGFQGSTPFMFDGSIPGQAGRAMPVRHGTVETVRNIFNASPDKVKSILKKYPVVSGAIGIASFAGLGYGAAALADRYNRDRTAGYTAYNRYLDKVAEDSFMGRNPGTAGALIGGTTAGFGTAGLLGAGIKAGKIKNSAFYNKFKGRHGKYLALAAGITGLAGAGIGAVGGKLMGRPEKKPGWYDRFAGYDQGNPYIDKHAISQGMLFWKGLKRPFKEFTTNRMNIASGAWRRMEEVRNQKLRGMADAAGRFGIRPDVNYLKEVISPGMQDLRALRNIQNVPSYFGALKQSYQAMPTAYRAGMLAVPAAAGAAGLGGIGYAVMPEEEAWYDRFAGYNQGNPYLDKTAVSQALYNSAVKKRLMNQIMGYGTNPSRTVNLSVIQNNMKNNILKNRDMSALRAITSGPVSGQDGYSGLFRNINIRNNAARNTANLTAEAIREMPWYMRPLAMVS